MNRDSQCEYETEPENREVVEVGSKVSPTLASNPRRQNIAMVATQPPNTPLWPRLDSKDYCHHNIWAMFNHGRHSPLWRC